MKTYTVGELRRLVREGAKNEFKPVYGVGVQDGNKKVNGKAYSNMKKETNSYNGGIKNKSEKKSTPDDNKGMSDLRYDNTPDNKRLAAQLKGYVSAEAERLHKDDPYGNADFGDDRDVNDRAKKAKKFKQGRDTASEIGLTGRELRKQDIEANSDTMFESKKIKKLTFKNMEFLTEGHMMSKIPDELKTEGNKFIMRDSASNEYLVEWHSDKPDVTKRVNKIKLAEETGRIKDLFGYKYSDVQKTTTPQSRVNEDKEFSQMLGRVRSLMK